MNEFPKFHPNQPALEQLSATKLNLVSGGQKSNQIQPGVGYRVSQTPGGTTVSRVRQRQSAYQHPWKVSANGDDTVTIGGGEIISFNSSETSNQPALPIGGTYTSFVSEELEITENGTIFVIVPVSDLTTYIDSQGESYAFYASGALTVELNPTKSGANLYIPIAVVELTDDIAKVTKQILTHNPIIQMGYSVAAIQP